MRQRGDVAPLEAPAARKVTPAQALWWSAERFRRVALQPLDLCPPCDIQFLDYARAVLRNDILTNPVDEEGYRQDMLEAFHLPRAVHLRLSTGQGSAGRRASSVRPWMSPRIGRRSTWCTTISSGCRAPARPPTTS